MVAESPSPSWPFFRPADHLDVRGVDGTDKRLKALLRRVTTAFRTRDFEALTNACDALIDLIENWPTGGDDVLTT